MDIHENARTLSRSRMLMVQRLVAGWSVLAMAAAQGVTSKTVRKWRDRHAVEGAPGLIDRTSRPRRSPTRLAGPAEEKIETLRRQRLTGPVIARRLGFGRLSAFDPRSPIVRYEREQPDELMHIDIKKLGRIDWIGYRITGDRTGQSSRRAAGRG